MGKRDVLKIIRQFRKALEGQGINVDEIVLYGSWAKGTASKDSDIDLIVIAQDFEGKSYWERIDLLSEAIYKIFAPIEALAVTPDEWERKGSFICEFAKNGEKITP